MNSNKYSWWGSPRKITNVIRDRKISWLELFSDLVFIIAIHYLISGLSEEINLINFVRFILMFLLVFDIWNTFAIYFDLHGNTSIRTTSFTLLMVLGVALLSSSILSFYKGNYFPFIIIYMLIAVLIFYLWIRVVYFDSAHMLTTRPYLIQLVFQFIFLIFVLVSKGTFLQTLLLLPVVISKGSSLITEHRNFDIEFKNRKIPFEVSSSLQERYGTFTMIILGESMATLVENLNGHYVLNSVMEFILLSINVIGIFWLYYALIDTVHVKGHNYIKLALFRGTHVSFLLVLSLETFFLVNLFEVDKLWLRSGFMASLFATISLIFILKRFSKTTLQQNRNFFIGAGGFLVLFLFVSFRPLVLLTISDLYMIYLVIRRERASYLQGIALAK
ncbi:hypothetical protein IV63_GL000544 [Companilactobacillus crustorum]|uniref:Low temperature requirement protein A n=3 Tax=Companilactobacillus TaxID=2767879 RepID=A0A837RFK3_9LACO|nr:low temperature requirement protein A [Companilactobacillus crustorum]KRK41592.1 hypothetical protein FD26_GL001276 [Companilactobacillus crustorum JCM 15951]KRO20516.1 hypothetical protein IV63_GL000544 [Companilactobacillus crustorum]